VSKTTTDYKYYFKQTRTNKLVFNTANGKNVAKTIVIGIGKVFYYFGVGLWIFCKLLGRGIQTAYHNYEAKKRVEAEQRRYYAQIERENYHAGRGYARGVADVRSQERARQRDERDYRAYQKRLNKMFEPPQVNDNLFLGDAPSRKKKKRSVWDY
jgi:hypothetical protein